MVAALEIPLPRDLRMPNGRPRMLLFIRSIAVAPVTGVLSSEFFFLNNEPRRPLLTALVVEVVRASPALAVGTDAPSQTKAASRGVAMRIAFVFRENVGRGFIRSARGCSLARNG